MKLYELERSGNCYKVRLLCGLLGLAVDRVTVNLAAGEQMQPWFLKLNLLHHVPVLEDDGIVLRDSGAILVYLAAKHSAGQWYPSDAAGMAEVQQWLAYANNEVLNALAPARAIKLGIRKGDLAQAQEGARGVLAVAEQLAAGRQWLALGRPTIADVAMYPYIAMIPVAGIPLEDYPELYAWTAGVAALPGYVPLPQVPSPS
jgi:glutathione S-transferase